ncbi:MAG TPA: hypothetical protein VJC06_04145 [Candidatus Paceibacterota bacterium]
MDKIGKAIRKFTDIEKNWVREIAKALRTKRFDDLNTKKLKGVENIFRVKKGRIRVIYQIRNNHVFVLKVGRKKEDTYKL